MKKIIMMLAVMFAFAANASAQDGNFAVGGQLNLGVGDGFTNYGIGARAQYSFTENWRANVSANYFFKKDYITVWDISADVHYLFAIPNTDLKVYPLAGVALVGAKVSLPSLSAFGVEVEGGSHSTSDFAFDLGAGAEYPFADNLKGFVEVKAQIKDGTREIFTAGVAYTF